MSNATETPTPTPTRCRRCGTILRHKRPVCPSCGTEVEARAEVVPEEEPPPTEAEAASVAARAVVGARRAKPVAAKEGVKICAMCLTSVPESEMVVCEGIQLWDKKEFEGQLICPDCHKTMAKSRHSRKQSPKDEQ